jgi:sec-independent protein translocase protein TatC
MTAEPTSDASDPRTYHGEEMTLVEHLRELRSRLFKCVVAIVVGMIAGFAVHRPLMNLLTGPYCQLPNEIRSATTTVAGEGCRLIITDVLGQFFLVLKVSAVGAIVIAGPVIAYQIWRFVTPGLRPIERRYAIPFFATSVVLFAAGAVFRYLILPRALANLRNFAGPPIVSLLDAGEYLRFMIHMMIGFGVAFEMPLILVTLILMGVVGSRGLRQYRRQAIFGTFVAAAVITPTTDPLTMSVMAGPLVLFYELSIVFARFMERRRRRAAAAPRAPGAPRPPPPHPGGEERA